MSGVVEQLVLGSAPIDVIVLLGAAVENPGVATRAQFPVERELEVSELVAGDDVVDGARFCQYAIDDAPAGGHGLLLVSAPGSSARSIEERAPAAGALFSGQRSDSRRRGARALSRGIIPHRRTGCDRQRQLRDDCRARDSSMNHGFHFLAKEFFRRPTRRDTLASGTDLHRRCW